MASKTGLAKAVKRRNRAKILIEWKAFRAGLDKAGRVWRKWHGLCTVVTCTDFAVKNTIRCKRHNAGNRAAARKWQAKQPKKEKKSEKVDSGPDGSNDGSVR